MPTMGALRRTAPSDPRNGALPKVKTPPSAAVNQYPRPSGVAVMPTMGALSRTPPSEPWKVALPKENTPPSAATSQYPLTPVGRPDAHDRGVEHPGPQGTVEGGVAEGEHAAVGGHQPVAAAVGGGGHPDDGGVEMESAE